MPKNRKPNIKPRPKIKTGLKVSYDEYEKEILVERTLGEGVSPIFSDGLLVQHQEDTFNISFLQMQYPLIVVGEEVRNIDSVEQRCVAQIVVTAIQMAKNVAAMNRNFKKFLDKQAPEAQEFLKEIAEYIEAKDEVQKEGVNNQDGKN